MGSDVGASMWRAEGGLLKFLWRANLFGERSDKDEEEKKERFWDLDWWDLDEDEEEETSEEEKAKAAIAVVVVVVAAVATDLRNAIFSRYFNVFGSWSSFDQTAFLL